MSYRGLVRCLRYKTRFFFCSGNCKQPSRYMQSPKVSPLVALKQISLLYSRYCALWVMV
ncbi:hypothetical protein HanIR_Chr10g0450931 [Helianthus annuus]|nr:hypothetical protein HanIR_Chr10g0450931 [Helianthus annuus]